MKCPKCGNNLSIIWSDNPYWECNGCGYESYNSKLEPLFTIKDFKDFDDYVKAVYRSLAYVYKIGYDKADTIVKKSMPYIQSAYETWNDETSQPSIVAKSLYRKNKKFIQENIMKLGEATSILKRAGYKVLNETVDIVDEVRDLLKHYGYDDDTIENVIMDYKFIDDLDRIGIDAYEIAEELIDSVYGKVNSDVNESTMNEAVKDKIADKIYELAEEFGHGVNEQGNGYLIYNENIAVEDDDEFQDKLEKELGSTIGYDGDGDGNLFVWIEDIVESTQMNEALEGPATSKQLWTLFKLTKQDYRNKNLSKEDAFKMIGELLDKKKNGETTTKPTNVKKATPKAPDADSPVKIGEIYHRMWGYSMCINDYYKVIDVKGKKALVVELPKKAITGDLSQGKVVPVDVENPSRNGAVLALIKPDGTLRIKNSINKYETFHQWDGEPDWEDHWD